MSNGVLNLRHFLGRLLISTSASVSLSSVTLAKSVFLGKNSRSKPLLFSGYRTKRVGFIGDGASKLLLPSPF